MLETNFILKFTTGGQIEITEVEYKTIFNADDNASIGIERLGIMVQKRMVQIFPKNISKELEDRRSQQVGVLHDGTKVRKHFGQWVLNSGDVPDDNGNYSPIRLDPQYYPEAAMDNVATPQEYLRIKENNLNYYEELNISERIKRIDGDKKLTHIFEIYDI